MGNIREIGDNDFQTEVLGSPQPVLVDFWAPWRGPCRMLAPLLDQLASENAESVKIVKVNVDDSPTTAQTYGVFNIPTLVLFKGGQVVDRFVGLQPKQKLQEALSQAVG